jgi:hypothetical protein
LFPARRALHVAEDYSPTVDEDTVLSHCRGDPVT